MDDFKKSAEHRISRLHVPTENELDDSIKPVIAENKRLNGYVENWLLSLALNPETLKRSLVFFESLFNPGTSQIESAEREMIALIVSAENGCAYCEAHHTKGLAREIKDPTRARRIGLGYEHVPDLTPREHAIANLATKITRDPKSVSDQDIDDLRNLGLDDKAILEVIETAAFFNFTNRISIPLKNPPEDALFDLK